MSFPGAAFEMRATQRHGTIVVVIIVLLFDIARARLEMCKAVVTSQQKPARRA